MNKQCNRLIANQTLKLSLFVFPHHQNISEFSLIFELFSASASTSIKFVSSPSLPTELYSEK